MIKGVSDSRDFNFILDTGASKTVIDDSVATILGYNLKQLIKGDRLMTAGGAIHSKILKLSNFNLFGKDMPDFEVNVIDFPLQIKYYADGVLGMDFLLQFENIRFDFEARNIET